MDEKAHGEDSGEEVERRAKQRDVESGFGVDKVGVDAPSRAEVNHEAQQDPDAESACEETNVYYTLSKTKIVNFFA